MPCITRFQSQLLQQPNVLTSVMVRSRPSRSGPEWHRGCCRPVTWRTAAAEVQKAMSKTRREKKKTRRNLSHPPPSSRTEKLPANACPEALLYPHRVAINHTSLAADTWPLLLKFVQREQQESKRASCLLRLPIHPSVPVHDAPFRPLLISLSCILANKQGVSELARRDTAQTTQTRDMRLN